MNQMENASSGARLKRSQPLPLRSVHIEDRFWSDYIRLVRDVVVPYQWEALNDRVPGAEPSHAIRNLRIAAGDEEGSFYGMVFQDSDVSKWLEAAGYLLATEDDPALALIAEEVIDLLARAQQPDGYLNTYFTLKEPGKRWTNLNECHELYCAGHLIEAAVSYYTATGNAVVLGIARRFADYIATVFGPEDAGKLQGYDGHQEIELALVKLYRVTGDKKYLSLSQFFLDQRGTQPHFYKQEWDRRGGSVHFPGLLMSQNYAYSQAHLPVREQNTAEGHAVRLVYMSAGMADVAAETGDAELLAACRKLWRNIVTKRMYITGGIGSMTHGESFTFDYDLPSDTVYAETCASIGLIFFAWRMLQYEPVSSEYADVLERALYNTVVSGMSRDGRHFFYVNPLEVHPASCAHNHNYKHVKPERQGWFGCACCPPNIARLLASLGQYIYTVQDRTLYTHLYIGGQMDWELDGQRVHIVQESDYAWNGKVAMKVEQIERIEQSGHSEQNEHTEQNDAQAEFTLSLRIPSWCGGRYHIQVNGSAVTANEGTPGSGYVDLKRIWQAGDVVNIAFEMPVLRMKGHPLIRDTIGKTALQRGPFVYCMEEADNGANLHQIMLTSEGETDVRFDPGLLGGLSVITAAAERVGSADWQEDAPLYTSEGSWARSPMTATFIPYYAWANRGVGEMAVWVRDSV
ncbi:glycoside hydrolase family 127 protein [Paenibacillus albus]|uniref:Glycoside hydrolase family 127 protein n=1 Tax=Paenibacillus albus TaxID=2495582 RepID=A0A3S9ACX0_9BACL|nr:glycoside hydrolase family 127 protein [Paenibacillus albus]